jgi:hypothetical protein
VLFPPPEPIGGTGCMISRHVTEIWGPILDIDHARGLCDEISMNTLRRVAEKLDEAAWLAGQMKAYVAGGPGAGPRKRATAAASRVRKRTDAALIEPDPAESGGIRVCTGAGGPGCRQRKQDRSIEPCRCVMPPCAGGAPSWVG